MSGCFATICVFFEVKPKNIFRNVISTQEEGRRIFLGFTIHIDQIFTRNPRCTSLLLSKRRTEQKSEDSSFSTKTILLHNSQLLFWFLFDCFFLFLETFCLLYRQLFFPQSRYFGSFSLSNNSLNTTLWNFSEISRPKILWVASSPNETPKLTKAFATECWLFINIFKWRESESERMLRLLYNCLRFPELNFVGLATL